MTLEAPPDEKDVSEANIVKSNQKSLEPQASLNRDVAEDQDEAMHALVQIGSRFLKIWRIFILPCHKHGSDRVCKDNIM